jgi:hypothetical protein
VCRLTNSLLRARTFGATTPVAQSSTLNSSTSSRRSTLPPVHQPELPPLPTFGPVSNAIAPRPQATVPAVAPPAAALPSTGNRQVFRCCAATLRKYHLPGPVGVLLQLCRCGHSGVLPSQRSNAASKWFKVMKTRQTPRALAF